jgi:hypothetical protein
MKIGFHFEVPYMDQDLKSCESADGMVCSPVQLTFTSGPNN